MPQRVDQGAKRAAAKRRSALAAAAKLSGEQQREALEKMLESLSAQLTKSEAASATEEKAAAAATEQSASAEAELSKASAAGERLTTLMTQLQERHRAVTTQRQELLDEEERERNELSEYFKTTIESVNAGLSSQGGERMTNLAENERLHSALVAMAHEYDDHEKVHSALLLEAAAMHAALEVEFEHVQAAQAAVAAEEQELAAREQAYVASDKVLKERLGGFAQQFETVQVELKETNKQYAERSAELTAATTRLRETERVHQVRARREAGGRRGRVLTEGCGSGFGPVGSHVLGASSLTLAAAPHRRSSRAKPSRLRCSSRSALRSKSRRRAWRG